MGPVARGSARRPGRHLDEHVRVQPPGARLRRVARRPAEESEARARQAASYLEGDLAGAAPGPPSPRERPRHHRAGLRPLGSEHRLHLAALSAVCRDVRRSLSVRRTVRSRAGRSGPARGARGSGCLCVARHAVQRRRDVLQGLLRSVPGHGRPRNHVDRIERIRGEPRGGAAEHQRAGLRAAARRASARLRVRHARRNEQRQRKSLLRRAARGHTADGRAGGGREARGAARRGSLSREGVRHGRNPTRIGGTSTGGRPVRQAGGGRAGVVPGCGRRQAARPTPSTRSRGRHSSRVIDRGDYNNEPDSQRNVAMAARPIGAVGQDVGDDLEPSRIPEATGYERGVPLAHEKTRRSGLRSGASIRRKTTASPPPPCEPAPRPLRSTARTPDRTARGSRVPAPN